MRPREKTGGWIAARMPAADGGAPGEEARPGDCRVSRVCLPNGHGRFGPLCRRQGPRARPSAWEGGNPSDCRSPKGCLPFRRSGLAGSGLTGHAARVMGPRL